MMIYKELIGMDDLLAYFGMVLTLIIGVKLHEPLYPIIDKLTPKNNRIVPPPAEVK